MSKNCIVEFYLKHKAENNLVLPHTRYLKHVLVEKEFLEKIAEIIETNVPWIAAVKLRELFLERIGCDFEADFLHELFQLWQADRPLPPRVLHGIKVLTKPPLLL